MRWDALRILGRPGPRNKKKGKEMLLRALEAELSAARLPTDQEKAQQRGERLLEKFTLRQPPISQIS
jgi:hypothetical protein